MVIKIKLVVVEYRVLIISPPRSCYYSWERTPERTVAQRGVRESHGGKIIRKPSLTAMKTRKLQNIRFLASKPRSVLFISLVLFFFERLNINCLEDFIEGGLHDWTAFHRSLEVGRRREQKRGGINSPTSFLALTRFPLVTNMTDCYSGTSI